MIIDDVEKNDVVIRGNNSVQDMAMKIDHKAFSILIDKLYSRKQEAIIREICSNACDAHVAANMSHVPYELTLPTLGSNELIVRDFGEGLSKDDVVYYLGTLFGSRSSESNNAIGGFGLGAKSPFCLVDSYHITSYHKGKKHNFFYVREPGGVPKFVHLDTSDTDEHSGIKFTVNVGDSTHNWRATAEHTLALFDVKPKCNIELEYPKVNEFFDTGVEYVRRSAAYAIAVMGGVAYPIQHTADDLSQISRHYQRLQYNGNAIILRFDIGDIDIAPSRESLEYTKKTIDMLNDRIESINKSVSVIKDKCDAHFKENLTVIGYDDLLHSEPLSLFTNIFSCNIFDVDEAIDYPELSSIFNDPATISYMTAIVNFDSVFRTKNKIGFTKRKNVIINDTHHSYDTVFEQVKDANVLKQVKGVSDEFCMFFLARVCDYRFGKGNYTIRKFSDLYVKPERAKRERASNDGYILGARDMHNSKILKSDIDFDNDTIVYYIKDSRRNNTCLSDTEITNFTSSYQVYYAELHNTTQPTAITVTPYTAERLGLLVSDKAINILDAFEEIKDDIRMAHDIITMSVYKKSSSFTYSHNMRYVIKNNYSMANFITHATLEFAKNILVKKRKSEIDDACEGLEHINVLSMIEEHMYYRYNKSKQSINCILGAMTIDKKTLYSNVDSDVEKMTIQEVINNIY